jgi:hypothetical protein
MRAGHLGLPAYQRRVIDLASTFACPKPVRWVERFSDVECSVGQRLQFKSSLDRAGLLTVPK